jgi:peroxiredoxin
MVKVGEQAPNFSANAFVDGDIKKVSLDDYKGKWKVVLFYPADFKFVCPTELGELADKYEELKKLNVEVLSVSTDTEFVHKAWHDASDTIKKIKFPMVADPTHAISKDYEVLIEDAGVTLRGTFIIDPDGVLMAMEVHADQIGRNADELMRKIQAAQFVASHEGMVCPASWTPGKDTLKPGMDLVGKI